MLARTGFEVLALGLVLGPVGIDLPVPALLAAYGFSQLVGGLPGPPGGIGLVEAGLVGALAAFGVDPQTSLPAVLVYRLVSYWIPAAAGLLAGGAAFVRAGKPTPSEVAESPLPESSSRPISRRQRSAVTFRPLAPQPGRAGEALGDLHPLPGGGAIHDQPGVVDVAPLGHHQREVLERAHHGLSFVLVPAVHLAVAVGQLDPHPVVGDG